MLIRPIKRAENVSEQSIEYDYEYHDVEYEYDKKPEPSDADEGLKPPFFTCVESPPRPR